jgi:hypothetical protein
MKSNKCVEILNSLIKFFSFGHHHWWNNSISCVFTFSKFKNQIGFWFFNLKVRINFFYNRYCQSVCNIPHPITTFTKFRMVVPINFAHVKSFYKHIYHRFIGSRNADSFVVTWVNTSTPTSRTQGGKMLFNSYISFPVNNSSKVCKSFLFSHAVII